MTGQLLVVCIWVSNNYLGFRPIFKKKSVLKCTKIILTYDAFVMVKLRRILARSCDCCVRDCHVRELIYLDFHFILEIYLGLKSNSTWIPSVAILIQLILFSCAVTQYKLWRSLNYWLRRVRQQVWSYLNNYISCHVHLLQFNMEKNTNMTIWPAI